MKIDYDNLRAENEDRIIDLQELQRLTDQVDENLSKLGDVTFYVENLQIAFGNLDGEGQRAVPEPMRTALAGLKETFGNLARAHCQIHPSTMTSSKLGLAVISELNKK